MRVWWMVCVVCVEREMYEGVVDGMCGVCSKGGLYMRERGVPVQYNPLRIH